MQKQIIIAHRGESWIAPENTLSSIKLAWKNDADAVEIDVRLTQDNKVVVIHDANTKRISGINRSVRKNNLDVLKTIDMGSFKDLKYKGESIPILEEVLNTVPEGKKILIEIKSGREIVPFLKETISKSTLNKDQIEIISFNLKTLIEVRKQLPQYTVMWVSALNYCKMCKFFTRSIDKIIAKATKYNMHGIDLYTGDNLTPVMVKKVKSAGLKFYVWTVNNPEKVRNLLEMGVDGITSDRASWIKNQLNKNN